MSWRNFVVAALCALGLIVVAPAGASAACTTTWTGPATGGSWETAASWSAGTTPTTADEVCLPAGTDVSVGGSPSTARQIHGLGATLTVSGTLELADAAVVSRVGTVRLYGTLRGAGELRAVDGLAWSGGTLGGDVVLHAESTVAGTLDGGLLDGTTFRNDGSIVQSNGTLSARDGALFHNTGTFVLNASRCWGCSWDPGVQWSPNGDAQPRLVNTGTIGKTTSGSATISLGLDNDGTVAVDQGELTFTRGSDGSVSRGDWTGSASGTAILDGPLKLGTGVQVAGALRVGWSGDVTIGDIHGAGATLAVQGTLRLEPGGSSRVGAVSHTGVITGTGTLGVAHAYDLGGGQLTAGATVLVEDTATGTVGDGVVDAGTLRNEGVLAQTGSSRVWGRNGALISNAGTYRLDAARCWGCSFDTGLLWNPNGDAQPRFVNTGTLGKTTNGSTTVSFGVDNDGTVAIDAGEVAFTRGASGEVATGTWGGHGGTAILDGVFTLGGAANLDGSVTVGWSGDVTAAALGGVGGALTVNGALTLADASGDSRVGSLTHAGTIRGAGRLRVSSSFTWGGGQLVGTGELVVAPGAVGTVGDGTIDGFTLRNEGSLEQTGSSRVWGRNGGTLENAGTYTLNSARCWGCSFDTGLLWNPNGDVAPRVINTGTLRKTSSGSTTVSFGVDNDGAVSVSDGDIAFARGVAGAVSTGSWAGSGAGMPTLDGPFTLGSGTDVAGALTVGWSGDVQVGDIQGSGGTLRVNGALTLLDDGGVSRVGTLVHTGAIRGAGELRVGSTFTWGGGQLVGTGRLVIGAAADGEIGDGTIDGFTLRNEGSLTQTGTGRVWGRNGGILENDGTLTLNSSRCSGCSFDTGFLWNPNGDAQPVLRNTGTLRKTNSGWTNLTWGVDNDGAVDIASGDVAFTRGATGEVSDGAWSGSAQGRPTLDGAFVLGNDVALAGEVVVGWSAAVSAGELHGAAATLTVRGPLQLDDAAGVSRVGTLSLAGSLAGPGRLRVADSLGWSGGTLTGGATLTAEATATGTIGDGTVDAATLRNDGSLTQSGSSRLWGRNGALLDNRGTYVHNGERCSGCSFEAGILDGGVGATPLFRNAGTLRKTEGSGTGVVTWAVENLGTVRADTGTLDLRGPNVLTTPQAEESYGPGNPATPNVRRSCAGKPVDCATGNQFEVHTDLAVGGRGLGLGQTRTYNSQAATTQVEPGPYGYGWTGAYTDRLVVEADQRRATVYQADGSTVPFVVKTDGTFGAPAWVQAKLVRDGTTYVYTLPTQVRYVFDAGGRLTSQVDRNGNATTIAHDGAGRVTTVTDPAGRALSYAYDGEQVASVTDPSGLAIEYEYDSGELVEVRYEDDEDPTWAFDYDGSHQLTHMTDARGGTTVTEYDAQHRATRQTDALNRTRQWQYLSDETRITEPNDSITHTWFEQGQPTRIVRAEGTPAQTSTRYVYDGERRNTEVIDGNGHATTFTYDGAGNRTSATDPTGRTTRWTYNATRDLLSAESPGGKVTTIERDANGNPTAVARTFTENGTAKSQRVEMTYDAAGQLTSTRDALGKVSTYEYDAAGNQTAAVDATGKRSTATFDGLSRVASTTTPGGHTTTITRDRFGRPTKTTDALGRETLTEYDDNGNVVKVTDPAGRETAATYDAENQLLTETLGDGSTRHVAYDAMGAIASRTDGAGKTTTYHHDVAGNVTEVADPLDRRTVLRHDAAGNIVERIDALSRSTRFAYDDADRPTRVTSPAPGAREVTYGYDAEGRQVRATDASGDSTFAYDDLGRLAGTQTPAGEQVGYGYDAADRLTRLTYPNGEDVVTAYDDAGRPTSVTDWLGNTTALGYDDDSNPVSKDMPGTPADTYAFDAAGGMTDAAFDGATLDYGFNGSGELTSIASAGLPGAASESFAYDAAARLGTDGLAALAYDLAGNATKLRGTDPLHYDAAGQLTSATTDAGEVTYGFDAVGQRTSRSVAGGDATTYAYDSAGQLTSVATDGTVDATYGYDALGLRVSKTVGSASPVRFVWDQASASVLQEGATSYVYTPDGLPLASISGTTGSEEVRWFHHDRLGSTRSMTDETGVRVGAQTFDAYGTVAAVDGTERIPFGFAGQYTDEESGLVQMGARMYDPATGQFLTRDPLEDLTLQPYLYAGGDPVNAIDPSGLFPIRIGLQDISDAAAGFGDTVTFGGTKKIREALGVDDVVDYCSGAYTNGGYGGTAIGLAIPVERLAGAGVKLAQSERVRGALGRVGKRLADETGSISFGGGGKAAVRSTPRNLTEQMAMEEAKAGAGRRIMQGKINDSRYPENTWAKMEHVHRASDGSTITIHYWQSLQTGARHGFKFK